MDPRERLARIDAEALRRLERMLYEEIPLTRAMAVTIAGCDRDGLRLRAPLAPNLNHKRTAFGGSLGTLATLAGWGLLQLLTAGAGSRMQIVIQASRTRFLLPVSADFEARCAPPDADDWRRFARTLARRGRARITLGATIATGGRPALSFEGEYVVQVAGD